MSDSDEVYCPASESGDADQPSCFFPDRMNRDQLLQHLSHVHGYPLTEAGLNHELGRKERASAAASNKYRNADAAKKELIKARRKASYEAKKEGILAKNKANYEANKEVILARNRASAARRKEVKQAKRRAVDAEQKENEMPDQHKQGEMSL
ncbi:hypothetical protein MMC18_004694 [Xylographa bjoerkii]|nr:hypothetical protein [Xylographa bjoerkii]